MKENQSLELGSSLRLWRYWVYRANVSYRLKYRDSLLGLLWPIISLLTVTLVIGFVWGILLGKEDRGLYFLYLLCGFPVWTVISGAVEQGCRGVEINGLGGLPFFTLVLERAVIVFLPFVYMMPFILLGNIWFGGYSLSGYIFVAAVILVFVFWVLGVISLLISVVSMLPDLKHLIAAVMRLAFLATPIIWEVGRLGQYQKYIWLNPFFIPLETIRNALLDTLTADHKISIYFVLSSISIFIIGITLLATRVRKLNN